MDAATAQSKDGFHAAMQKQLSSPSLTDFTIVYGDKTYEVHRFVISMHSGYFMRLCEGNFAETASRTVTLRDDPPAAVHLMVEYFYSFACNLGPLLDDPSSFSTTLDILSVHSWLFTLADKYDIPNPQTLALDRLGSILEVARQGLERFPTCMPLSMIDTTKNAYMNSPPSDHRMRKPLMSAWLVNDKKVMGFISRAQMEQLVADVPEFATELVGALGSVSWKGETKDE